MELVYLWGGAYKNIYSHGFDFSPKFSCNYEYVKRELTITKNDDYIPNFFGNNINVTAIVGKNGSGKSGLIKFIRLLLKHFSGEYIKTSPWMILFYDAIQHKFYCLTHEHLDNLNIVGEYRKETIIYVYNTDIEQNEFQNIPFLEQTIFPLLDYSLSYDTPVSLRNFYKKPQSNRFLDFPNKSDKNIYLYDEHIETIRKVFQNFNEFNQQNQWKIFEDFFNPRYISISFNMESFKSLGIGQRNNIAVSKYLRSVNEAGNKIDLKFIQLLYSRLKDTKESNYSQLGRLEILKKLGTENYFHIFDNLCSKNNSRMTKKKSIGKRNVYNIFEFEISNILETEIDYLLQLSLSEIFTVDIIDESGKKFNELSFGEQQLLKILNIIYYLSINDKHKNLFIFLDEIDIGFHPDWQKKILKYILKLTKLLRDKSFHLLITSHSPFLLSDIPKQNIIFLDKDEKGNCKILSHNEVLEKKQTFGANIHTLLSDSFFMSEGLMGEFAKGKINEIKKLYQLIQNETVQKRLEKEKTKKLAQKAFYKRKNRLWQIQKIIGEPFLQKVIKNYLNELEIFFSDDKTLIAKELVEIEERRKYLEALQKRIG